LGKFDAVAQKPYVIQKKLTRDGELLGPWSCAVTSISVQCVALV